MALTSATASAKVAVGQLLDLRVDQRAPSWAPSTDRRARSDGARPFKRGPGARLNRGLEGQG